MSGFELLEEVVIVGGLETEETRKSSTVPLRRSQLRKMVRVVTPDQDDGRRPTVAETHRADDNQPSRIASCIR